MRGIALNLTGQVFGELTVISLNRVDKLTRWNVRCSCGKEGVTAGTRMVTGRVRSCGHILMRDLAGMAFGELTIKSLHSKGRHIRWNAVCSCGREIVARSSHLLAGITKSCGHLHKVQGGVREFHGLSKTPEYRIWQAMKDRCLNLNNKVFSRYGGRGITVCDRWRESFDAFIADVGRRPSPDRSIDRIDNDGNYEPGNCRWATSKEQRANQRGGSRQRLLA